MSVQRIQQYYTKVEKLIQYGGSKNETAIRSAFQSLLEQYCADKNLILVPELKYGTGAIPDGTLKDALRQDWGYWESKDTFDSLDDEIQHKLQKGYPTTNILFEDSQTAVLLQNGAEVSRVDFKNADGLNALLVAFVSYEPKEVQTFRAAIEKFKQDLPGLVTELRQLIEKQAEANAAFAKARSDFLELCRKSINPHIVMEDVREMLIQHILTEDIFITIFSNAQFHQENNIAHELAKVVNTFFTGAIKQNILIKIDPYIKIIKAAASNIYDHHEKQRFLKVVYENFYKAYNPAGADRLGIIYTPNEIVRFMVEAADYLTNKHFGRGLGDKNVEILDPATGTGTFITEIIEYLPNNLLPYKYETEIHCNEVAILPYYIANLNIEYTYAQKMGTYAEFKNICFVDTLENLGFDYKNKQYDLLSISADNLDRIKRQNERKISVIIGNPPYNANQLNENQNNKNRPYPKVDRRIKDTYIKNSTAQKTKLYDMYSRFIRWASDRLAPNGVIAFVSNNSFINARTYDGFRKVVADEFNEIYVIDMKGDARTSGERRRREGGNVFSDQIRVGVAVYFLVKKHGVKGCHISYNCVEDYLTADTKKAYLRDNKLENLPFVHIHPDKNYNWINLAENDWDDLIPLCTKAAKFSVSGNSAIPIFRLYSNGVVTARDEWIYDFNPNNLKQKVSFFCKLYEDEKSRWAASDKTIPITDFVDRSIKWTSELESHLLRGSKLKYNPKYFRASAYRPFVNMTLYFDRILVHRVYLQDDIFGIKQEHQNSVICFSGISSSKPFQCWATNRVPSFDLLEKTQCLPLYRYDGLGNQVDNITAQALSQFQEHYQDNNITRPAIFHYVYAVLHDPSYRRKYEINLRREFPRVPFYADFWKWEAWGKQLVDTHLNWETVAPYGLKRVDTKFKRKPPATPMPRLKADKQAGTIELDTVTTLKGVPKVAWEYKLGNRSALEWVIEYHKERKPKDPTILKQFNTYRFADYKEQVIDQLQRVCTVSVETMKVIKEMETISPGS